VAEEEGEGEVEEETLQSSVFEYCWIVWRMATVKQHSA
jgi:hypothetical protein